MADESRELAVKIIGDASEFVKATDDVSKSSDKAQSGLETFASGAKKASLVLAGAGIGLTALAKNSTDYTVGLYQSSKDLSKVTGETIEQSSQLVAAAHRMGVSADTARLTFGTFSKQIQSATQDAKDHTDKIRDLNLQMEQTKVDLQKNTDELAKNQKAITDNANEIKKNGDSTGDLAVKTKTLTDQKAALTLNTQSLTNKLSDLNKQVNEGSNTFDKLGINVLDAQGNTRGFNDLLLDVADKFKGMKDGTEKTTDALTLFGRSGKDLIPLLDQGKQGIQNLEAQAEKLGLTLTAQTVGTIAKYIKSQKDLQDSTNALKIEIGNLTTPVLTSFNQHLNQVATALLSTHNPFHAVVIDTIAFGGPIAGAASGLVNFTANLATSIEALGGFRLAATALTNFMMGPWALAFSAVALTLGVVAGHFFNNTSQAQNLAAANRQLKTDTDALKGAQDNLANAQLGVEGAQLNVEQAQLRYNDAVAQFGPSSLEARQALHDLKQAQEDLKTAQDNAKDSLQQLHDKENEVAKDKTFINHLKETRDNIQGVGRDAFDTGQKIQTLNGAKVTVKSTKNSAGQETIDFVSTFGGGLGHNATGTDSWSGGPTWVGEKGPEIIVPPKGSQIIPADKSVQLSNATASHPQTNLTFNVNVGMYAGMPVEKRQIALELYKELVRAARAQGTQLQMIGAIPVQ